MAITTITTLENTIPDGFDTAFNSGTLEIRTGAAPVRARQEIGDGAWGRPVADLGMLRLQHRQQLAGAPVGMGFRSGDQ